MVREEMSAAGLDAAELEVREVRSDDDAARERFVGSPTIRVDGRDVQDPGSEPVGLTCRVYRLRDGRISRAARPRGLAAALAAAEEEARRPMSRDRRRPRAGARSEPARHGRRDAFARADSAGRRSPSSSGPATTARTRSPGTTAWSTSPSDYADRGVRFLAVNSNDAERYPARLARRDARALRARGWPFPYLWDASQEAARAWGAQTTPHVFVLDADRRCLRGRPRRRPRGSLAGRRLAARGARRGARGREPARRPTPSRSAARSSGGDDCRVDRRAGASSGSPPRRPTSAPGYDVLAAALTLELELEVEEAGEFSVEAGADLSPPTAPTSACARSRRLHPADGLRFEIRSEIPLAARPRLERRGDRRRPRRRRPPLRARRSSARDLPPRGRARGPPRQRRGRALRRLRPLPAGRGRGCRRPRASTRPQGVEAVVVIPDGEVPTAEARAAIPAEVPLEDAVANVAAATQLVLGIERSDLTLIGRGLADRLHQPARARPLSALDGARRRGPRLGAIGATISGAGPTCCSGLLAGHRRGRGGADARRVGDWAEVRRVPFSPLGADVPEL